MSAVSTAAAEAASIDWNVVAGAIATLFTTGVATWWGLRKGKQKVENPEKSEVTSIIGASIIESSSITLLGQEIRANTDAMKENTRAARELLAEQRRTNDLILMGRQSSPR